MTTSHAHSVRDLPAHHSRSDQDLLHLVTPRQNLQEKSPAGLSPTTRRGSVPLMDRRRFFQGLLSAAVATPLSIRGLLTAPSPVAVSRRTAEDTIHSECYAHLARLSDEVREMLDRDILRELDALSRST